MERNFQIFIIGVGISLCLSSPAVAKDVLSPAMFESNKEVNSVNYTCPEITGGETSAVTYCDLVVNASGALKAEAISCMAHNKHREFAEITPKVLTPIKFKPATVNNEPATVRVSVKVIHKKVGGNCGLAVVLNNGLHGQEYGATYIAPQEIVDHESFMQEYFKRIRKSFSDRTLGQPGKPYVKAVNIEINDDGQIGKIRFEPQTAKREIKRILRTSLKGKRFIPGHKDGKPIVMNAMLLTGGERATKVSSIFRGVTTFEDD